MQNQFLYLRCIFEKQIVAHFTCCFYWNLNENSPPPLSLSSKANYCCHRPWFCLMLHLPKGNGNHMPRHNPFGAALLCRPQSMHPLSFDGSGCSQSRSRFPLLLTHLPGPCCLYFKLAARLAHPPVRNAKKDRCMWRWGCRCRCGCGCGCECDWRTSVSSTNHAYGPIIDCLTVRQLLKMRKRQQVNGPISQTRPPATLHRWDFQFD